MRSLSSRPWKKYQAQRLAINMAFVQAFRWLAVKTNDVQVGKREVAAIAAVEESNEAGYVRGGAAMPSGICR